MWGAIILGGGSGQRMGAKCNKVLLPIAGKSMIVRSVEAFVPLVEQVVVVSREEDMPAMASELAQNGLDVPIPDVLRRLIPSERPARSDRKSVV